MEALLPALISTLLPILLKEAEALLGGAPDPKDHTWVLGFIQEIVALFDKSLPGWVKPAEGAVEKLVSDEVSKLLDATKL